MEDYIYHPATDPPPRAQLTDHALANSERLDGSRSRFVRTRISNFFAASFMSSFRLSSSPLSMFRWLLRWSRSSQITSLPLRRAILCPAVSKLSMITPTTTFARTLLGCRQGTERYGERVNERGGRERGEIGMGEGGGEEE